MIKSVLVTITGCLIAALVFQLPVRTRAQEPQLIADFSLKDSKSNDTVTLKGLKDKKAIVVVFTSSHCSFAVRYQERLNTIHQAFTDKPVAFLAINANDPTMNDVETIARMRAQAPYVFPYLKDVDQAVAEAFDVARNPEAFVLVPTAKDSFRVVYRGQIDDNPLDAQLVEKHYLKDAIEAVLAGRKPEVTHTEPGGCNIKWKRGEDGAQG